MASMLELFRKVVRQHTNLIGQPVDNIYGAIPGSLASLGEAQSVTWRKAVVQGASLLSLDEFYSIWSSDESRKSVLLAATEGALFATEATPAVQLFRTTLKAASSLTLPLTIDTGATSGQFAIYIDGVLQRRGGDALEINLTFSAGHHVIEIIALTQGLVLGTPSTIALYGDDEEPQTPNFVSVSSVWLDPLIGTPATELIWNVDAKVGGYRILRRQLRFLSKILRVTDADQSGVFGIALAGDQTGDLTLGEELHALHETMGTVVSMRYDADEDETACSVRLIAGASVRNSAGGWEGATATAGHYVELRRIRRTTASGQTSTYDVDVAQNEAYEYALQAYGLFNESAVSLPSPAWYIRAGDSQAPGSIVFSAEYPKVLNDRAIVRYRTPADEDYDGVQVFFRREYQATVDSATTTEVTLLLPALAGVEMGTDVYTIVVRTSDVAAGQARRVSAITPDTVTLDIAEPFTVAPEAGDTVTVYVDYPVITDRGVPDADDELTFDIRRYGVGTYLFRTFDLGNNYQSDVAAEAWEYDGTGDESSGGLNYTQCLATISSWTDTTITIKVTASAPLGGSPDVRLVDAALLEFIGPEEGLLVESGQEWTFDRPLEGEGDKSVTFESAMIGAVTDSDAITIAEVGKEVSFISCVARVTSSTATTVTVQVTATDPLHPGSDVTISVDHVANVTSPTPSPAGTTGPSPFVRSYTINRPDFRTGTGQVVWKVTSAVVENGSDTDAVYIPAEEQDTIYCECFATITGGDADTVEVTVTATPSGALVNLVDVTGTATLNSGAAIGVQVAQNGIDNVWVFNRGDFNSGLGQASFRATATGYETDDDSAPINEKGRDTFPFSTRLHVISTDESTVTARFYVVNPIPQGAGTVTVSYTSINCGTVTPTSPQTMGALVDGANRQVTNDFGTTGYIDFVIERPAFKSGTGRFVITASSPDSSRTPDSDALDVPAIEQDTIYCECFAKITSSTATKVTVTVTATPSTAEVQYVGIAAPATLFSGVAAGTPVAQNGTDNVWVFNRGDFQEGVSEAQFRATKTNYESDDDFATIPDQGRDTIPLATKAHVIATSRTDVTVRYFVADPYPRGVGSIKVTYIKSTDGLVVTPDNDETMGGVGDGPNRTVSSDINNTGYIDYTITRPAFQSGTARVTFTAASNTSSARVPDSDAVDVPAVEQDTQPLALEAHVTASNQEQITVRVHVADPTPRGANSLILTYVVSNLSGVLPTSPQYLGAESDGANRTVTSEISLTNGYVDFTVNRPAYQSGTGRITFTVNSNDVDESRVSASDSVDVPAIERDTAPLVMSVKLWSLGDDDYSYKVYVADPYPQGTGTINVTWESTNTGTVTPSSGQTMGTVTDGPTRAVTALLATTGYIEFTVPRPAYGTGNGTVTFRATASNRVQATGVATIPEKTSPIGTALGPTCGIGQYTANSDDEDILLSGYLGEGSTGTLQYRYRVNRSTVAGTWSAWANSTTSPNLAVVINVTRHPKWLKVVELEVRDSLGTTDVVSANYAVEPTMVLADGTTGTLDDSQTNNAGYRVFNRGRDSAGDVVETSVLKFIDGGGLDGSRRPISVYRGAGYEVVTNLFKRGSDSAGDVVETSGRTFTDSSMLDGSRRITSVYRSATTEAVGNLFKRGADSASDVVEVSSRMFTDSSMLDGSRRVIYVYRGVTTEAVGNLFKRGSDSAADVVESSARNFTDSSMIDGSRRIVNVYRGGVTEAATILFKRGADSAGDIVETSGRNFTDSSMLDGSRRVIYVYRGSTTEAVGNLFKRGSDNANQVVEVGGAGGRVFVDPTNTSSGLITSVYRYGVNEPVNNLMKVGDSVSDVSLSANIARLNTGQTWSASQAFSAGFTGTNGTLSGTMNAAVIRGTESYSSGWFRNDNAGQGLYNTGAGNHMFASNSSYWVASVSASAGGIMIYTNAVTALRGVLYGDSSGFGLLDSSLSWRLLAHTSGGALYGNWSITGQATIASGFVSDGSNTARRIASIVISTTDPGSGPEGCLWVKP